MDGKDDRDILLAIALAMHRISSQRVATAREAVIKAEQNMARIKQEVDEAEARLEAAIEEERAKELRDE